MAAGLGVANGGQHWIASSCCCRFDDEGAGDARDGFLTDWT